MCRMSSSTRIPASSLASFRIVLRTRRRVATRPSLAPTFTRASWLRGTMLETWAETEPTGPSYFQTAAEAARNTVSPVNRKTPQHPRHASSVRLRA